MFRKLALSAIAFSLLCLALGQTQPAPTWEKESTLSSPDAPAALNENMGRCLIADGATLHVVWVAGPKTDRAIFYRQSTDNGATWKPEVRISPANAADAFPLLAQSGSTLHLVFVRGQGTPQSASYYKRSTDAGKTWGPDVVLGKTKWWPGVAANGKMVYVSLNTVYDDDDTNSLVLFRKSKDNGETWDAPIQISNAPRRKKGRSEDPAIVAAGSEVHLVWNDNRDADPGKGMAVYYRRSMDSGTTFGPEAALTKAPEFTYFPTLSVSGTNVYLAYGDRQAGPYSIFFQHSADHGATWSKRLQASEPNTAGALYPALASGGDNVHIAWSSKQTVMYSRSTDAGKTWRDPSIVTEKAMMPFLDLANKTLHMIFLSQKNKNPTVHYLRTTVQ